MANKAISKFEATMIACQKNKKLVEKRTRTNPRRKLHEEDELLGNEKILNEEGPEADDYEEYPDDVQDDIVVVVDPELDSEDFDETLDGLQEIIDETPEGEVPFTDEYIDDLVYTCPVCGNNFFSETELKAGDTCPVCGEVPDNFVLVGDVADNSGDLQQDDVSDEDTEDTEDIEDNEGEEEEDTVEDTRTAEEAMKRRIARRRRMEMVRRKRLSKTRRVDEGNNDIPRRRPSARKVERRVEPTTRPRRYVKPMAKVERRSYSFDEKTFNPFLTKFVKENYSNTRAMRLTSAKLIDRKLRLECKILFKSGKTKNTTFVVEGFRPTSNGIVTLRAKADSTFKAESSRIAPFTFECVARNNVLSCRNLRYNFSTVKEGRRYQVTNRPLTESRRPVSRKRTTSPRRRPTR